MWLWRVKWRWVWLVWGVLVRTCHPGQTHQVSWLDLSKNILWNHSTSSSILSKVLVKPWSLLLTKIKVYFYSRGSQIQCASTEHPSTLGPLLYFYLFWPLLYSIFSHFSHILFFAFCHLAFTVGTKVRISSRGNAFLMWLRKNLTGSAVIDRNNHGSIVHTHCIPISCRHCHKDGRCCCFPQKRRGWAIFPRHSALIGDNNAWSKQGIRSRARWCHILPSLHYGGYIYYIMMCCANKTFGCHGHAHLLDSAPREELFMCSPGVLVHG